MELNKLKYFQAVARLQHVTKAADELHVAQPALTKSIKDLESELGAPLFYKQGRNIRLTPQGIFLKEKLDAILPALDDLPLLMAEFDGRENKTVRLNVLAASTVVTDAVVSYKKSHADVIFELIQNEEEYHCDVTVTTDSKKKNSFLESNVFVEPVFLAVPKHSSLAQKKSVKLEDVKNEGFVRLAGSRLFRAKCDEFCAKAGFSPTTAFESDSPLAVRNVIGAGVGVGFYPAFSWGKTSQKDVVFLPIQSPTCTRNLVVGLHGPVKDGVAKDFYRFLIGFLQRRAQGIQREKKQE
ncbi:MAG: LysR family transcriptional regulator [Clostridia bacterium]|nr:LysR family transcriptional regulator [Clostridia bacterium]